MNKFYWSGLLHIDGKVLPDLYPEEFKHKFLDIIKRMVADGLLFIPNDDSPVFIARTPKATEEGIRICNEYRQSVSLPLFNEEFKRYILRNYPIKQ